jgi:hypothetical protein
METFGRQLRSALDALRTLAVAAAVLCAPPPASAQQPDLNLLALDWIRGRYAYPVVCEGGGEARRAVGRLVTSPGRKGARPTTNRITFHGFDVSGASSCKDVMGSGLPEVQGSIEVTLPGARRPDLAPSDFQRILRTQGGFDFDIVSGRLRLTDWSEARASRLVEFKGGTARYRRVRRGTDADRILSAFESPHKLTLELTAPGSETLRFPLALYDVR